MRPERDFRPQQLYGVTQRGNQGQWVYRDDQDFQKGLDLMGAPLVMPGTKWAPSMKAGRGPALLGFS